MFSQSRLSDAKGPENFETMMKGMLTRDREADLNVASTFRVISIQSNTTETPTTLDWETEASGIFYFVVSHLFVCLSGLPAESNTLDRVVILPPVVIVASLALCYGQKQTNQSMERLFCLGTC